MFNVDVYHEMVQNNEKTMWNNEKIMLTQIF